MVAAFQRPVSGLNSTHSPDLSRVAFGQKFDVHPKTITNFPFGSD